LDCNELGDLGLKELCASNILSTLEVLTVGFNKLSDFGIRDLAAKLGSMNKVPLKVLSFDCNQISDAGVTIFAQQALRNCTSLETLSLSFNRITETGAKAIADVLPMCGSLKELTMNSNQLGDVGLAHLAKVLPASKLQKLVLTGTNVSNSGVKALVEGIKRSDLHSVNLSGNEFSAELSDEITRAFETKNSAWYKTVHALCSIRDVPRLGRQSKLSVLPKELIRKVAEALPADPDVSEDA
jgi:Ran GTPase-activating protein (RanGAP) involved in mRNA processing and transport